MSDKTTSNRESLLKITALVRPALATLGYIPALQHISFDGRYATAFNDVSAISARMQLDLERCVPGELLIRALQSFSAENVAFIEGKNGALKLSAGRSSMTLPTLPLKNFPLEWPQGKSQEIELDHAILKGIDRCLMNVGKDPTKPEQMGVTLDIDDEGRAVLFSTDFFSMSRYQTKSKIRLPGDSPVILPTFFCTQALALAKAYEKEVPVLYIHADSLVLEFGDSARLLTRTLVELEPPDFPKILSRFFKLEGIKSKLTEIPDAFDAALGRALLVLDGEADKITEVEIDDGLVLHSTSAMGDADDRIPFKAEDDLGAPERFYIDPQLTARGSKPCALIGFLNKAVLLADSEAAFLHLVSYLKKSKADEKK